MRLALLLPLAAILVACNDARTARYQTRYLPPAERLSWDEEYRQLPKQVPGERQGPLTTKIPGPDHNPPAVGLVPSEGRGALSP